MQERILVVDDDADDCQLLAEVLIEVSWPGLMFFEHNAVSALRVLNNLANTQQLPALVIVDINLPGTNGMDLLKTIKQHYPGLKVLMYSTTCTPDIVTEARENGALDCLTKATNYTQHLEFGRYILSLITPR